VTVEWLAAKEPALLEPAGHGTHVLLLTLKFPAAHTVQLLMLLELATDSSPAGQPEAPPAVPTAPPPLQYVPATHATGVLTAPGAIK
jgi:hypothetical protein